MTPPDARARVEAWMWEDCPHTLALKIFPRPKQNCPDCLLAFAAARVREERETWLEYVGFLFERARAPEAFASLHGWKHPPEIIREGIQYRDLLGIDYAMIDDARANVIRARRERPG